MSRIRDSLVIVPSPVAIAPGTLAAPNRLRPARRGRGKAMPRSHFPTDPDENAASIVNAAEVVYGALDAAGARSVAEIGAFHGKSTRELLAWAEPSGARIVAIDPTPEPALRELAAERSDLELIE